MLIFWSQQQRFMMVSELHSRCVHVVIEGLGRHPPDGQPALSLPLVDVVRHHVTREAEVSNLNEMFCVIVILLLLFQIIIGGCDVSHEAVHPYLANVRLRHQNVPSGQVTVNHLL